MIINHNISSMRSQGALFQNNNMLGKDLQKLSTGLRINNAADDASGLAISERMRTQIRGQEQAKRNTMDGISALNIAEGAYNEIHAILQRQRELSVQASTLTYTSTERGYMSTEFNNLSIEINRIISATKFNGIAVLKDNEGILGSGQNLWVDANSNAAVDGIKITYENIGSQATVAASMAPSAGQVLTDSTGSQAVTMIDTLDKTIKTVNTARATIGATINRLESTVNNLTVSITNQQAAESQIRDLDFAYQSSQFTKNQILTQSATAMLTQANATTQGALSLIR
jgi:flagellin